MTVITIQSQVVHGKVGNSAAVPVLQAHGIEVAPVPTTLLSNHPHYPTIRGRILPADLVGDLLQGLEERGIVDSASALITGFLGSVEIGAVVARFVERTKARNPSLLYVCDPVCGDDDLGAFVDTDLQKLFVERLLPLADVATPNSWELHALTNEIDRSRAARHLQASGSVRIVVTGGAAAGNMLETHLFDISGEAQVIRTPRLSVRPAGTGDLFTAALTARLVTGETFVAAAAGAVAATYAVLERTSSEPWAEMPVEAALREIVAPTRRFAVEPAHE